MWKVYSDNYLIYAETLDDYRIFNPSLSLELNKTGAFTFTIFPDHPNSSRLDKLKSIVTVYQDNELYFRGRILNDVVGWHNEREISCEGELAFLLDSIQRPFNFPVSDEDSATPEDYLNFLIDRHNSQVPVGHQFLVGNVTVTDPNDYISRSDTEYSNTLDLINSGLIDSLGGYLWIRHENGLNYLDYLSDLDFLGTQPIEFGKNLLDFKSERKGENIATAIIPLGSQNEETQERLTISDLPDEETSDICKSGDFVYSKVAENIYGGRIAKVVQFDDVTIASNLLTKAKSKLQNAILREDSTEFSAADLSGAGMDFDSFRLGTYVRAKSSPHSIDGLYLVRSLNIDFQNPASNTLSIGAVSRSMTEENKNNNQKILKTVETNISQSNAQIVRELEQRTDSLIAQTSESIMSRVEESYYVKGEIDSKVSEISTEIEQQAGAVEIRFNQLETNIGNVEDSADAQFSEIRSFIRLENGNIILGLSDGSFRQVQSPTKNSFYDGQTEVAYISNKKMFISDGEFTNSLQLGKFAFIPRENGNLSFKKVID